MPYFSLHWLSSKHFSEFLHIQYFRLLLPQHCFEMKQVRIRNGLQSVSSSHSISVSHTDTRTHAYTRARVHIHAHTEGKKTEQPMFKALQFFSLFLHFIPSFFRIMKNVGYETLDSQRSTQLSAILIQTQSDKMVTLSAHWQFIPD